MDLILILVVAIVLVLGVVVWLTRQPKAGGGSGKRPKTVEALDTLMAWQPTPTRVLTGGEREAYVVLRRALPEHLILAQVPLARFLKVPTRHSYTEWLRRVGQICADIVICEPNSLAVAVVEIRSADGQESERAQKRQARMERVIKASGMPLHIWREGAIPDAEEARNAILQSLGLLTTQEGASQVSTRGASAPGRPGLDGAEQAEPPSSTWFDDLDSAPAPLSPPELPRRR
ncbi:DUF2726 domain-containing protein [Caldimonas caldifontis]|uniref:DUF2726 domain-containing protein n=1 Tax=Caldimonas caldifontis TaxID=1452508 RepID=A0A2S5SYT3_9BURK|nr:DUF2726 domain-containing protein [Caldimonas caldifontis]PPE67925.1 hypothetical protein C1704_00110 [Caldimonas caldifontis]